MLRHHTLNGIDDRLGLRIDLDVDAIMVPNPQPASPPSSAPSGVYASVNALFSPLKHGLGLNKILGTIHIYPTLAEANKYVAGNWKKAHKPEALLNWVARFHAWRRG